MGRGRRGCVGGEDSADSAIVSVVDRWVHWVGVLQTGREKEGVVREKKTEEQGEKKVH